MLVLKPNAKDDAVYAQEVLTRKNATKPGPCSRSYVAMDGDTEVGWLSLELWAEGSEATLYELFVVTDHRRRSVGNWLLESAERIVLDAGYSEISLTPKPLDAMTDREMLKGWYERRGYS